MSTPLTDRIEALTAQANATTGASDTTLTDAVGRLIGGYGNGGIDVTFTDDLHSQASSVFANYLFSAINGEVNKQYVAILKNANNPDSHQLVISLAFFRESTTSAFFGGGVRQNITSSRKTYSSITVSSDWNVRASAGDTYTIYTL